MIDHYDLHCQMQEETSRPLLKEIENLKTRIVEYEKEKLLTDAKIKSLVQQLEDAEYDIDIMAEHNIQLQQELAMANDSIKTLRYEKMKHFNNEECWIFQKDGGNQIESLSCPIVIYPNDLINIIQKAGEFMQNRACAVGIDGGWMGEKIREAIRELPPITLNDLNY